MSLTSNFESFIKSRENLSALIVQPRMGFSCVKKMREGLKAVKNSQGHTMGTITLDSFTRNLELSTIKRALEAGEELNGYPLLSFGAQKTQEVIANLMDENFQIQVRHGSPRPYEIFKVMVQAGLKVTEGGPVSYCLPYSSVPLREAIAEWAKSIEFVSQHEGVHVESFGGCLLGQLCHPTLLIAIVILECLFFKEHGLKSMSLSYTQGTNIVQDQAAVGALKKLIQDYLGDVNTHVVVYNYMGLFPETPKGFKAILEESVFLSKLSGVSRLIVKTAVESKRIPTIKENTDALNWASQYFQALQDEDKVFFDQEEFETIYEDAKTIIETVLNISNSLDLSLLKAFENGVLDIPFCLHPDNLRKTSCTISDRGYLEWGEIGGVPLKKRGESRRNSLKNPLTASKFHEILRFVKKKFDGQQPHSPGVESVKNL